MEVRSLTSICRGTGTWSGNVMATPLPIPEINHIEPSSGYVHKEELKLPNIGIGDSLPKTFATRHGALLLFADKYKEWRKQLSVNEEEKEKNENAVQQLQTLAELRSLVLSFGLDDDSVIKRIGAILNDDSLIQVRPGFSYNRYASSAVRLWDPTLVDKYLENDGINRSVVEKYFDLLLPDVTVNGIVLKDTLVGSRLHRYNSFNLPDIGVHQRKKVNIDEMDSKLQARKKTSVVMILPKIDFTASSDTKQSRNLIDRHSWLQKYKVKNKTLMDPNQKKFWNNYEDLSYDEKADLLYRMLVSRRPEEIVDVDGNDIVSSKNKDDSDAKNKDDSDAKNKNDSDTASVKSERTSKRCIFPKLTANPNPVTIHVEPAIPEKHDEIIREEELPRIAVNPTVNSMRKNTRNVNKSAEYKKASPGGILNNGHLPNNIESTDRVEVPKFMYKPSKLTSYGVSHIDQTHTHRDGHSNGLVVKGMAFHKNEDNFSNDAGSRPSSFPIFPPCGANFNDYNPTGRYVRDYSSGDRNAPVHYTSITTPYNIDGSLTTKSTPNLLRDKYLSSNGSSRKSSAAGDFESVDSREGHLSKRSYRDVLASRGTSSNAKSNIEIDLTSQHGTHYNTSHSSVSSRKKDSAASSATIASAISSYSITKETGRTDSEASGMAQARVKAAGSRESANRSSSFKESATEGDDEMVHEVVLDEKVSHKKSVESEPSNGTIPTSSANGTISRGHVDGTISSSHAEQVLRERSAMDEEPSMLPELIINEEHKPGPPVSYVTPSAGDSILITTYDSPEVKLPLNNTDVEKVEVNVMVHEDDVHITDDVSPMRVEIQIVADDTVDESIMADVVDQLPHASEGEVDESPRSEVPPEPDAIEAVEKVNVVERFSEDLPTVNVEGLDEINDMDAGHFPEGSVVIIVDDGEKQEEDKGDEVSGTDPLHTDGVKSSPPVADSSDTREESDSFLSSSTLQNISSSSLEEDVDINDHINDGSKEDRLSVIVMEVLNRPESGIDLDRDLSAAVEVLKAEGLNRTGYTPDVDDVINAEKTPISLDGKDNIHVNEAYLGEGKSPKPEPFKVGTAMEEKPKFLDGQPKKSVKKVPQTKKKSVDKKGNDTKKSTKKGKTPPPKPPPDPKMTQIVDAKMRFETEQNREADLNAQSTPVKMESPDMKGRSASVKTESPLAEKLPDSRDSVRENTPSIKSSSRQSIRSRGSSSASEYKIHRSPELVKEEKPPIIERKSPVKTEHENENEKEKEKEKTVVNKKKREKSAAERRAEVERKRKVLEEKRRLEKEEKLRESELYLQKVQEEERRNQQLQMEMEEELSRQEEEKKQAFQMERDRLEAEEMEKKRKGEEAEKLRKKKLADEEAQRKKMEILMAERQMELEFKRAQEEMARAIELDMAEKERLLMEQMAEEERRIYEEKKKHEEELRAKEDAERARLLEIKRKEEEERRSKELEELLKLEARQLFTSCARRTNRLLEIQQQVSRAYTYSYFNLLPIIFYGASDPALKKRARKVPNLANMLDKLDELSG